MGPPRTTIVRRMRAPSWRLGSRADQTCFAVSLLLGLLCFASPAAAQNCPANKTCFYVPPQMPPPPHPVTWDLVLSAGYAPVTGTYTFPGQAAQAFTASVGSPVIIALSSTQGLASAYSVKEQRGVFVVADGEGLSVATREITGPWNNSATIKDHNTALGTRFRAGGYTLNSTSGGITGIDVIMLYAPLGATVVVTPPAGVVWGEGLPAGPQTIVLAAQQTYLLRTDMNGCGYDLTGALITSDQPISVMSGGRGWGTATCQGTDPLHGTGCGDDGFDNLIPTSGLGTVYAVDGYPAIDGDRVSVVADENGTDVYRNGTLVATLAAGGKYEFQSTDQTLTLIETSKPAYVFQNAGLDRCEHGLGIIPPLSFSVSSAVSHTSFNVFGNGQVSVFIPTANASSVKLDGVTPSGIVSQTVPGRSDVTRIRFAVSSGNHTLSANGDYQLGLVSASTAAGGTGLFAYYNRFRVPGCGDGTLADGEGCDDNNVVDGDGCSGACRIELGHPCESDGACVANGRCDPDTDLCVARCNTNADCDDSNQCTTDACNMAAGTCVSTPTADGTPCDDGLFCSNGTTCSDGECNGGTSISCAEPDWATCDEGFCDEAFNMCSIRERVCSLGRVYFYGVVRTGPDTLGSIRCWREGGVVSCDMQDGELVVGAPVCE